MIRVWDPLIRTFHWALALSFAIAWFSAEGWEQLHSLAGYVVGALVVARGAWGVAGPRYARFRQFVRPPRVVLSYLGAIAAGNETRFIGHNPAGGAMVVALLALLTLTALSGWLLTTDALWGSEFAQALHSLCAQLVLLMIALHLAGVALASIRHHENLVGAMFSGMKRSPQGDDVG